MPWLAGSRPDGGVDRERDIPSRGVLAVLALAGSALAGCDDDDGGGDPVAERTTDADCAGSSRDEVFTTLGWTPTAEGATSTVRGCHREAEQGYVEVPRARRTAATAQRSATTGDPRPHRGAGPGRRRPWLERRHGLRGRAGRDVGQTKVVVLSATATRSSQVAVAVLTSTPREQVREAVRQLPRRAGSARRRSGARPSWSPGSAVIAVEPRVGGPVRLGGRGAADPLEVVGGGRLELGGELGSPATPVEVDRVDVHVRGQPRADRRPRRR